MKDLNNLEIGDYPRMLWRRRWYLVLTAIIVIAASFTYTWWLPDIFRSETRIAIESPLVSGAYAQTISRSSPADRFTSIREQIASRTFLERMIEQYQIAGYGTDPDFVMEKVVKSVHDRIMLDSTSNTTFTLSFATSDPNFAQSITKHMANELIRTSSVSRKEKVIAADQFIDDQLRQVTEELSSQEEKIAAFKAQHFGQLPEQMNANINRINGLNTQLSAVENALQQAMEREVLLDFRLKERDRLNRLSQRVEDAESTAQDIEGLPASPSEAELEVAKKQLASLQNRYTPKHPDVVTAAFEVQELERKVEEKKHVAESAMDAAGLTASEYASVTSGSISTEQEMAEFQFEAQSIQKEIKKREKEKLEILNQIKTYQSRLNLAPALENELAGLMRDTEVLQQQYQSLQKQKFDSQLATTVETENENEIYSIIDEASLPVKAEFPNRPLYMLLGIVGGIGLGIGAAIGREMLDTTISSEEEAMTLFELPVLASIPEITETGLKGARALR